MRSTFWVSVGGGLEGGFAGSGGGDMRLFVVVFWRMSGLGGEI